MFAKCSEIVSRFEELQQKLVDPEVVKDQSLYARLSKESAELQPVAEAYTAYRSAEEELASLKEEEKQETDRELKSLYQEEIVSLEERAGKLKEELRLLLLPKDKNDVRNCTLEIRAGAGGEEAALFAYDLYRMYMAYAEKHRLHWEIVDVNETELGGMKEVIVNVSGKGAYGRLKYESGVHRVQRVPETESQGRLHTSTVTVAVLPEAEEVEVEIAEKDIRVDLFRSSGAGGQKVNKTETAIRITHFPTGIVVTCQDERSQLKNKEKAFRVLRARIYDYYASKQSGAEAQNRKSLVGTGDRSERIRTYNFPQSRVTDHRIGYSTFDLTGFLAGNIDEMTDALVAADRERQLASSEEE